MAKKKFYETAEFKKLQAEWAKKLEDSGFQDIEKTEDGYQLRKEMFSLEDRSKHLYEAQYLRLCNQILEEFEFKCSNDKLIFALHSRGHSEREIEAYLKENSNRLNDQIKPADRRDFIKPVTNVRINKIINEIKESYVKSRA